MRSNPTALLVCFVSLTAPLASWQRMAVSWPNFVRMGSPFHEMNLRGQAKQTLPAPLGDPAGHHDQHALVALVVREEPQQDNHDAVEVDRRHEAVQQTCRRHVERSAEKTM